MPRRKEEGPVAWPRQDEEELGPGMACRTAFSSQLLCFHGCLCWLALRWITLCWIRQGQGILMEVGEVHNAPRVKKHSMLIHAMVICASRLIELENIPSYATQNDAHNGKATTPTNYLHVLGCIEDLDSRVCLIQVMRIVMSI